MKALVMAGGEGRRLRPLTISVPKPLLEVWERPILEHVLLQLAKHGIDEAVVAIAHLGPMIEDRIGNGDALRMSISYYRETNPLGTAGALGQIPNFNSTIVMMNGDVLTDLDFSQLVASHRAAGAILTVATKVMHTDLTLGVLDTTSEGIVTAYREKPRLSHRFGLGMYVIDPTVKAFLGPNERIDMPEVINRLIAAGQTVSCYDHGGQWIDIGTPEEYARVEGQSRISVFPFDSSGSAAVQADDQRVEVPRAWSLASR
jgi:NDP-sugar pyrophosphorylase family protein